MSKKALLVVGILLVIMGVISFIPAWTWAVTAQWYAIVKIVVGLIAIYISIADKQA